MRTEHFLQVKTGSFAVRLGDRLARRIHIGKAPPNPEL